VHSPVVNERASMRTGWATAVHASEAHQQIYRVAVAEQFMTAGVDGLSRDQTHPLRIPPVPVRFQERTVAGDRQCMARHRHRKCWSTSGPRSTATSARTQTLSLDRRFQMHHRGVNRRFYSLSISGIIDKPQRRFKRPPYYIAVI